VEDHPIDYNTFEGTIPKGEYGGGTVMLWDRGTYTSDDPSSDDPVEALRKGYAKGEIKFALQGERLRGSWVLVRTRRGEQKPQWLLIKHKDKYASTGADIVADLVDRNQRTYGSPQRWFMHRDVVRDALPPADLVLCRDCMIHLSNADVLEALRNVRRSGARYLLATTYSARAQNADIVTGDWRAINLQAPPFRLPQPVALVNEEWDWADGYHADKCLALWDTTVLPR